MSGVLVTYKISNAGDMGGNDPVIKLLDHLQSLKVSGKLLIVPVNKLLLISNTSNVDGNTNALASPIMPIPLKFKAVILLPVQVTKVDEQQSGPIITLCWVGFTVFMLVVWTNACSSKQCDIRAMGKCHSYHFQRQSNACGFISWARTCQELLTI